MTSFFANAVVNTVYRTSLEKRLYVDGVRLIREERHGGGVGVGVWGNVVACVMGSSSWLTTGTLRGWHPLGVRMVNVGISLFFWHPTLFFFCDFVCCVGSFLFSLFFSTSSGIVSIGTLAWVRCWYTLRAWHSTCWAVVAFDDDGNPTLWVSPMSTLYGGLSWRMAVSSLIIFAYSFFSFIVNFHLSSHAFGRSATVRRVLSAYESVGILQWVGKCLVELVIWMACVSGMKHWPHW